MGDESSLKTLPRNKILKSRKEIARLFQDGLFTHQYPIGLAYRAYECQDAIQTPFQVAFSVPRKKFKKAVHRNLLKRRMREAFRLHQTLVSKNIESDGAHLLHLMFIYQSAKMESYQSIERAVIKLLKRMDK